MNITTTQKGKITVSIDKEATETFGGKYSVTVTNGSRKQTQNGYCLDAAIEVHNSIVNQIK